MWDATGGADGPAYRGSAKGLDDSFSPRNSSRGSRGCVITGNPSQQRVKGSITTEDFDSNRGSMDRATGLDAIAATIGIASPIGYIDGLKMDFGRLV